MGKFSCFRSFWGRPPRKTGGAGPGGQKRPFSLPLKTMDYMFNSQQYFHVCYVMLYMPITYFYSRIFSYVRGGALSKDFEYVPLQHK